MITRHPGGADASGRTTQLREADIKSSILALIVWIAIPLAAGAFGSRFAPGDWYEALQKPSWNPPGWVFGPVWTTLYILMGIAAWIVWRTAEGTARYLPLGLFLAQIVLNGLWSYLFFGLERPGAAFAEIVVLLVFISLTLVAFWRVRPAAGALLVPYLLWVAFASVLNWRLWRLNP